MRRERGAGRHDKRTCTLFPAGCSFAPESKPLISLTAEASEKKGEKARSGSFSKVGFKDIGRPFADQHLGEDRAQVVGGQRKQIDHRFHLELAFSFGEREGKRRCGKDDLLRRGRTAVIGPARSLRGGCRGPRGGVLRVRAGSFARCSARICGFVNAVHCRSRSSSFHKSIILQRSDYDRAAQRFFS